MESKHYHPQPDPPMGRQVVGEARLTSPLFAKSWRKKARSPTLTNPVLLRLLASVTTAQPPPQSHHCHTSQSECHHRRLNSQVPSEISVLSQAPLTVAEHDAPVEDAVEDGRARMRSADHVGLERGKTLENDDLAGVGARESVFRAEDDRIVSIIDARSSVRCSLTLRRRLRLSSSPFPGSWLARPDISRRRSWDQQWPAAKEMIAKLFPSLVRK
jgi:hypothetical protein